LGSRLVLALLVCASLSSLSLGAATLGPGLQQQLAALGPGETAEVIVTFQGDAVSRADLDLVRSLGITRGIYFRSLPILGVLATRAQAEALAGHAEVRSLWRNQRLNYDNYEATALTGVQQVRTDPTFQKRNGGLPVSGRGVGVLINDSGVDGLHQDVQYGSHVVENVAGMTNLHAQSALLPITWVEGVPNTDLGAGHGTHVAGIIGGTGVRSGGKYAGVAPGADLIGYGSGVAILVLDTLGGFDYALSNARRLGIRVINNSWGNTGDVGTPFNPDDPVNVATKRATDLGIVVVFSTGNSGPAEDTITGNFKKAPWVIAVANGTKEGGLNSTSSNGAAGRGGTVTVDGETFTWEDRPTVTAPGTFIISTRSTTNTVSAIAGQAGPAEDAARIEPAYLPFYTVLTGTSMAAPHVAGIVALMLEANPSLTPAEVKAILQQTATNLPGYAPWQVGAGYVNAYAAVDRAYQARGYGSTLNLTRHFNASQALQITNLPFGLDFNPVPNLAATRNRFPFTVPAGLVEMTARASATGAAGQTGNPTNLVLIAPDGTEYSSGVPLTFALSSNRTVVVPSPQPGDWILEVRGLRGDPANPTAGTAVPETVTGAFTFKQDFGFTGLPDIAGDPAEGAIKAGIAERLFDSFSDGTFRPDAQLTRGQLAQYLLMGAEVRQYFPVDGAQTFTDVDAPQAPLAEAAVARGGAFRDMFHRFGGVMRPASPGTFSPWGLVTRTDLAYALVQSLGLEPQAQALNSQPLTVQLNGRRVPIDDSAQIPAGLQGYVQLALDLNILNAYFSTTQGSFDLAPTPHATFRPLQAVTRGEYAVTATRFFGVYLTAP
jgi:serine protease AprX